MNQSHQSITDLEKNQDIPLPGSRERLDIKGLYSHRPPPSIGSKYHASVKPVNQSNHASDALRTISNDINLTISK
jgi:hypothetical protein